MRSRLEERMRQLDTKDYSNLAVIGEQARALILNAKMPEKLSSAILQAYKDFCGQEYMEVAVRQGIVNICKAESRLQVKA